MDDQSYLTNKYLNEFLDEILVFRLILNEHSIDVIKNILKKVKDLINKINKGYYNHDPKIYTLELYRTKKILEDEIHDRF